MAWLLLIAGLLLLVVGAEALVRGSARLAAAIGISPLVVGLTVVAFGTSSPELIVSLRASLAGQADIGLGNVVGSNIFNILFILGLSALVAPLIVTDRLVRRDVPLMIGVSLVTAAMAANGRIDRVEGLLLVVGLVVYVGALIVRRSRDADGSDRPQVSMPQGATHPIVNGAWALGGLGLLVWGSRWLLDGAVDVAQGLGASDLLIGLTIVAAGTSLPEVATSVIASVRGERDIAVGNVVGSNLLNMLGVLGTSSLLAPAGIPVSVAARTFDLPIMVAAAVACLPIFLSRAEISRAEGGIFLLGYLGYTGLLVAMATRAASPPTIGAALLFAVPFLGLVGVAYVRQARSFGKA
jgi:cation:H+ antiporter